MRRRIRVAITVVALAAGTALFIATPGAVAIQSQPVLAGAQNTANFETLIVNTNRVSLPTCLALNPSLDSGLVACGYYGVQGLGSGPNGAGVFGKNTGSTGIGVHGVTGGTGSGVFGEAKANGVGVYGKSTKGIGVIAQSDATGGIALKATALNGSSARAVWGISDSGWAGSFSAPGSIGIGVRAHGGGYGVYGSTSTGTGVFGVNFGATGIGVHGQTGGVGSAVFGEATANGVGVYGKSQSGTALRGDSPSGFALEVNGKAKFSRSGIATVAALASSVNVGVPGMTASSMVIATAQQNGSVFVKAAVPAAGSFKLVLTGNAPVGGLRVAYFVLN